MDPTATLARLLDAIVDKDAWTIEECLDSLRDWIARGGFIPELPEHVRACIEEAA